MNKASYKLSKSEIINLNIKVFNNNYNNNVKTEIAYLLIQ